MKENRPAIWAIIGVLIGFGLPVLACIGLTFAFSVGLAALGSQGQVQPTVATHVSGPMTGPAVAIIEVSGPIVSGRSPLFSNEPIAASGDLIPLIQQAALASDVRTILLQVNSPGGGVVASDEIYQTLEDVSIPIVVLMEDVAASGGYYISMAADQIIANPNTLTGSIGVISTFPEAEELLEKVGLRFTTITSGEVKDFGSPYRSMTAEEQEYWQSVVDEIYQGFIDIVVAGRDLPESEVLELADGRVYTGRRALELGMVDELGYMPDAIAAAAELGGISGEPRVIRFRRVTTLSALLGEPLARTPASLSLDWLNHALTPKIEYRWVP
jgi:protease-4